MIMIGSSLINLGPDLVLALEGSQRSLLLACAVAAVRCAIAIVQGCPRCAIRQLLPAARICVSPL